MSHPPRDDSDPHPASVFDSNSLGTAGLIHSWQRSEFQAAPVLFFLFMLFLIASSLFNPTSLCLLLYTRTCILLCWGLSLQFNVMRVTPGYYLATWACHLPPAIRCDSSRDAPRTLLPGVFQHPALVKFPLRR